jgi:DNA/RNA endonuclease YhcR with UshA esterase domain
MKAKICVLLSIFLICATVRAEQATTEPAVIDVKNSDAIIAAKGKDSATVEGVISSAEWSRSGKVMNIEFRDSDLIGAVFEKNKQKLDDAFGGDLAKSLKGAKVRIKGKIADYRSKPQIIIQFPDQITIVEPAPSTQPSQ